MSASIYVRLIEILGDLAEQARHVQPLATQLAIEAIIHRLDDMVEETIGMERPSQEEEP